MHNLMATHTHTHKIGVLPAAAGGMGNVSFLPEASAVCGARKEILIIIKIIMCKQSVKDMRKGEQPQEYVSAGTAGDI